MLGLFPEPPEESSETENLPSKSKIIKQKSKKKRHRYEIKEKKKVIDEIMTKIEKKTVTRNII